jgi:hypothetical protein
VPKRKNRRLSKIRRKGEKMIKSPYDHNNIFIIIIKSIPGYTGMPFKN